MTAGPCKQSRRSGGRALKARGASPLAATPRRSLLHGNWLATFTICMDEEKKNRDIHTRVKRAYTWSERQTITRLSVPRVTIKNLRQKHTVILQSSNNILPKETFLLVTVGLYTLLIEQTQFLQATVFDKGTSGRQLSRLYYQQITRTSSIEALVSRHKLKWSHSEDSRTSDTIPSEECQT